MSRIRSIHPGLHTDEAFVSLSMAARVLLPGIWTECDDHGVFEWKPITLKMKIFPADNVDVQALLDELLTSDHVKKFTIDGKSFGVVRNFSKWQRPKNPSYRFILPEEYREYSGLKAAPPPALPEPSPSPTEKCPQREEEGDKREKKEDRPKRVRTLYSEAFEEFWKAYPRTPNMSKSEAWRAWQRLPPEDQTLATAAIPKYRSWLKPDHPIVHACRFLSQRRFDGFNEPDPPGNVVPIGFYAAPDSPELDAWDGHNRKTRGINLPRDKNGGWRVPTQWPPDYEQAATGGHHA